MKPHLCTHFNSKLIYGSGGDNTEYCSVNTPIYQTSTFAQPCVGELGKYEYTRSENPTRAALEQLSATLEGGTAGFAFSTGMAAIMAVLSIFSAGDEILSSASIYGGTYRILRDVFPRFGLKTTLLDTANLDTLEASFTPQVKAVYIETPSNPLMQITDIAAVAQIAKRHGAVLIVDNTFLTPYLQQPIPLGADIVLHSATKYLCGHSDILAGLVVTNDDDLAARVKFVQNATGGVLPPMDAYWLIRSIKTLAVRMDRHVENAEKCVALLREQSAVKALYYPGLDGTQGADIHNRQAKNGGAMLSFELADGDAAKLFVDKLQMIDLAVSLGGTESLICHPWSMTHASVPAEDKIAMGITQGLIRFSVGIEDFEDIRNDLLLGLA